MAYIYLEELEKILPGILDQWIDGDDESWEWIFSEIEQKCYVGKKGKKKKKFDKEEHIRRNRVDIDALINKFQQMDKDLKQAINNNTQLGLSMKDMGAEIRHIREDVKSAKSMAQTAKQRTEVDYTQASKVKYNGVVDCIKEETHVSEDQVAQNIYNRMANRGATREELDSFREVIKKYDATSYSWNKEAKEIPTIFIEKRCMTCKFDSESGCMYSGDLCGINYEHWEAKDNE